MNKDEQNEIDKETIHCWTFSSPIIMPLIAIKNIEMPIQMYARRKAIILHHHGKVNCFFGLIDFCVVEGEVGFFFFDFISVVYQLL